MLGAASARVGLDLLLTRNFRIVLGGVQQHCSHAFEALFWKGTITITSTSKGLENGKF